jgi:hypothetical protein
LLLRYYCLVPRLALREAGQKLISLLGSMSNYRFTALTKQFNFSLGPWATGVKLEVYSLAANARNLRHGIFQYAPRGAGAFDDMSCLASKLRREKHLELPEATLSANIN